MRILFFTTSLGKGGAEKHLVRLANEFARGHHGVEPEVAVLYPGSYASALDASVPLHTFGKEPGSTVGALVRSVGRLRELIRERRPDVVCGVMELPALALHRAIGGLRKKPPFVVSVQIPPVLNFELQRNELPMPQRILREGLMRLAASMYRKADAVVAISEGVREDVLRLAPSRVEDINVIYNAGFDAVGAAGAEVPAQPRSAIACGRLVYQKGFDVLINAFARVHERLPDVTLDVLGEGRLRPQLQQQIDALELTDVVRLVGFKDDPEAHMGAADVFVLSSRFEGFGNVVTEAMRAGTATVATDCPYGPAEIVEDGESGMLVPVEDPAALADAIVQVFSDDALRDRLAEGARRRAEAFSPTVSATGYADLFHRLAAV